MFLLPRLGFANTIKHTTLAINFRVVHLFKPPNSIPLLMGKRSHNRTLEIEYDQEDDVKEESKSNSDGKRKKRQPKTKTKRKVKDESDDDDYEEEKPAKTKKRSRKPKKQDPPLLNLKPRNKGEPPEDWEEVWKGIEQMRKETVAPVDTMGCGVLGEKTTPQIWRYQTLISLMLSSQTKDQVTAAAMANLKNHGLTVENILNTDEDTLDSLISKVGFHTRKTKYIKETTEILRNKYNDDIPPTLELLKELPGVGPKMAYLTMQHAWEQNVGIGVDVHVHRIANRLGWAQTKTPEKTRAELESWLPVDRWNTINEMLVGFGQTICTPLRPKCEQCKINKLCPSSTVK